MMHSEAWAPKMTRTAAVKHLDVANRVVSKVAKKEREISETTKSQARVKPADRIAAERIAN